MKVISWHCNIVVHILLPSLFPLFNNYYFHFVQRYLSPPALRCLPLFFLLLQQLSRLQRWFHEGFPGHRAQLRDDANMSGAVGETIRAGSIWGAF